jgi:hypothetical protein
MEKKCSNCIGNGIWEKSGQCDGFAKFCSSFQPGHSRSMEEWEQIRRDALASKYEERNSNSIKNRMYYHFGVVPKE